MIHVVMVRVGDRYGPEYVEILSDMLARNLSTLDVAPWCVTDDPGSLPAGVNPIPYDPTLPGWWQKVRLFSPDMPWTPGDRIAYFDLDVVVTGRLEALVQTKGIISDWNWPGFNSSVMVWDHGEHRAIWDSFEPSVMTRPSIDLGPFLPVGQINGGDQEWIYASAPDFPVLPTGLCASYRRDATGYPPDGASVVVFHGTPKPSDITDGWVPQFWKVGGLHELPRMNGVNVTQEQIKANVLASSARGLPWFTGRPEHGGTIAICGGGPSLADSVADIRKRQRRGATILAVNNTLGFLQERGVKPDVHVMLDARPENAAFVAEPPEGTRYMIASQCDPSVFDALAEREVVLWHSMSDSLLDLYEDVAARFGDPTHPLVPVPGGGTVGVRSMMLAWSAGYRKIHIYGMDGSYSNGSHHAYPQSLNDADDTLEVRLGNGGKIYRCARWMARQAHEFADCYRTLRENGVQIWVHGSGLIPDMARAMRDEEQQVAA